MPQHGIEPDHSPAAPSFRRLLGRLLALLITVALCTLVLLDFGEEAALRPEIMPARATVSAELNQSPDSIYSAISNTIGVDSKFLDRDLQKPIWLAFTIPGSSANKNAIFELEILRFHDKTHTRIWIVEHQGEDPSFTRLDTSEGISRSISKGGLSIPLRTQSEQREILIETISFMPGNPVGLLWDEKTYLTSKLIFDRQGGMLFGCVLALAAFGLLVALLNKDQSFLLFVGLLLTSLRIGAINGGWDRFWLGIDIPDHIYLPVLRSTLALYGYFNLCLYLNSKTSISIGHTRLTSRTDKFLVSLKNLFLIFAAASPIIDHLSFLKTFWAVAALAVICLSIRISHDLISTRDRTSSIYLIAWVLMLTGMISEIALRSGALSPPAWLNSQFGAVLSALVLGLELTNRLNIERDSRVEAQSRSLLHLRNFERNFNSSPIGLFSINKDGRIALYNPSFAEIFA